MNKIFIIRLNLRRVRFSVLFKLSQRVVLKMQVYVCTCVSV